MQRVVAWIQGFAESLGGPGLFILAFLDSSFLSFPQVCDALIVLLTVRHEERMPFYALMTTLGSIGGCYALYRVGVSGGEALLRRRFKQGHIDRAMAVFRRYGMLAVVVPSLLPPPMPFKIFVLAAGVSGMGTVEFLLAVAIGRSIRYFGEGFLALWYGEAALKFLQENADTAGIVLGVLALIGGAAVMWWKRRAEARS
jgi:membrane protein YqaA with SNARE-associated domain